MTIVQVMHSHTEGGVERHVVDLCAALAGRGHRVYLACPNRGWLWDAVQGTATTPVHLAMDGLLDLTSVNRLTRLVRQSHADVVHAHMTRGAFYAAKAGRRTGAPVIASAHSSNTYKHYEGADRVLCASRAVLKNLVQHDVPEGRLRVVYHGIPPDRCRADGAAMARLRSAWGIPGGGWAIGSIGRITPESGLDTLMKVAALWKAKHPDARFVVAGHGDTAIERELRAMAQSHGVAESVLFIGHTEEACKLLAAIDALALPSRREPSALTLIEAIMLGTPAVASNVGGAPEIVEDGVTGFLVPPDDPLALAAALERTLEGGEVPVMVAAARRSLLERWPLLIDEVEANYRELLATR